MIDFVLLGVSSFARRRVLPALEGLDDIRAVHQARRPDYDRALDATPAPALVYVSTVSAAHALWVGAALERGHHVVVDKPATTTLADAERLVALARARGLVLAEALTYAFHPVVPALRALFDEHGSAPSLVTAAFTPPLPPDNWRLARAPGGGAILDTGPYFASIGRLLFGGPPDRLEASIAGANDEVETAYSVLARYGPGRALVGHFGFTVEYRNWLHLAGPALAVEAHGVFSTPPDKATEIGVRHRDAVSTRTVPPAFAMRSFLAAVLAAIARGDTASFADTLLADARVVDALRSAVK